jgi:signal transduction histidine kinase
MREMRINWKILSADVGGKWFLDRRTLIPLVPFLTVTSLLSSVNFDSDLNQLEQQVAMRYLSLLLANLFSLFLCWLYIELASATIFRNRSTNPVSWMGVLIFGASVGFLKGLTTGAFSYILGSEDNLEIAIANRILQTSLLGLWTLPVVALVAATYFKYQQERESLVTERIKLAEKTQSTGEIPLHQLALRAFIAQSKSKISNLQTASQGQTDVAATARLLRDLIEEGLRPISHQMWLNEKKARAGFRLGDLTLLALGKNPFPLALVALSLVIGIMPINLIYHPAVEAILRTFGMLFVILAVFGSLLLINNKIKIHPAAMFLGGNALASILGYWWPAVFLGDEITQNSVFLSLAFLLWLLQVSLFASVVTEVLTSRPQVRRELLKLKGEADINVDVSRAADRLASRDLAQYVHSNIQNQLLSRALSMETEDLTEFELQNQLSEVQDLLDKALETRETSKDQSLAVRLKEIVARWRGFVKMDLAVNIDGSLLDQATSSAMLQVVSEAISNSVRHGLARSVSIWIAQPTSDQSFIELTVIDDGLGPRSGPTGLGTELFSAVSDGKWEIKLGESGGTELKMHISVPIS